MHTLLRRAFPVVVLFFFVIKASSLFAAEKKAQQLVCLQATRCDTANNKCTGGNKSHRVYLTTDTHSPSRPNTKTYIVECISTDQGQICTTGNADTATDVGWDTSLADLKKLAGYTFQGAYDTQKNQIDQLTHPIISDSHGGIPPIEWQSSTDQPTYHTFYALNIFEPIVVVASSSATQKQSTFDFVPGSTGCTSLRWDPYGVVFDAETLEPIPDVQVRLYEKNSSGFTSAAIAGVLNPVATKGDGVFNFIVPDGVYKLSVVHPNYFLLPTDATKINSNYSKIYSDLYYSDPQSSEISQSTGVAQHRDIGLIPRQPGSGVYPIKVMDYYQYIDTFHGSFVIKGRVSHPLAKIKVYTTALGSSTKIQDLPDVFSADKSGSFVVEINLASIPAKEQIGGLEFEKVDLEKKLSKNNLSPLFSFIINQIFKSVYGQVSNTVTLPIQPIPTNLDGFAYDEAGKLLPHATVGVYLPFSKVPYYQTEADDNGHFKIDPVNLPSVSYLLRYSIGDQADEITVSKFLNQNSQYIESIGKSPLMPKDTPTPSMSPTPTPSPIRNSIIPPPRFQSTAYAIVVIIVLCFGIIGVLIGFHLMEQK